MTSLDVEFDVIVILQVIWLVVLVCVNNYFSLCSPLDYLQNSEKKVFFTTLSQTKLYFDSMQNSSISFILCNVDVKLPVLSKHDFSAKFCSHFAQETNNRVQYYYYKLSLWAAVF